jgi:hypothetical protein
MAFIVMLPDSDDEEEHGSSAGAGPELQAARLRALQESRRILEEHLGGMQSLESRVLAMDIGPKTHPYPGRH